MSSGDKKKPSGRSAFGSSSSSRKGSGLKAPPRPGTGSRLGGRNPFSRAQAPEWTISPFHRMVVRFGLEGLGDPFHRLLGTELNARNGKPAAIAKILVADDELRLRLEDVLNEAWDSYRLKGAILLYPWQESTRKAFTDEIKPVPPAPPKATDEDDNYYDDDLDLSSPPSSAMTHLRAIDMALVLNVLARSRSQLLVSDTPLGLEPGFLTQTIIADDPRLVDLAQATGCIEESWS